MGKLLILYHFKFDKILLNYRKKSSKYQQNNIKLSQKIIKILTKYY